MKIGFLVAVAPAARAQSKPGEVAFPATDRGRLARPEWNATGKCVRTLATSPSWRRRNRQRGSISG